jgi:anhydro-N-acetylmuramic acid kinase
MQKPGQVIAFDTGPGNMVIDAVTEKLFGQRYDRDGRIAASGRVLDHVVAPLMQASFFRHPPPKTAGREEFGRAYAKEFLRRCGRADKRDAIATASALTVRSIADAVRRFVLPKRGRYQEMIVSGGGANNPTLMAMLRNELAQLGIALRFSTVRSAYRSERAVAFAVLGYETRHRRPSNAVRNGAKRPRSWENILCIERMSARQRNHVLRSLRLFVSKWDFGVRPPLLFPTPRPQHAGHDHRE